MIETALTEHERRVRELKAQMDAASGDEAQAIGEDLYAAVIALESAHRDRLTLVEMAARYGTSAPAA